MNPTDEHQPSDRPAETEHDRMVRRDERLRLADILTEHRDVLSNYASRPENTVELIALLLRLDDNLVVPPRHSWGGHLVAHVEDRTTDPIWRVDCSGCDWFIEAPMSQALAAGREHEALNLVAIR